MVLTKVLCDQALHVPLVVSAFYTCVNTLQRKNDIILDLKSNSRIHLSATFFCFSQQSGHGTLKSAFTFLNTKEANAVERAPEK
eukprot:bmy_19625T0